MDVFEKRLVMIRENEQIFKKYYRNEEIGIIICDDRKEDFKKKGSDLLNAEVKLRFEEVRSIYYRNIINNILYDYSFPEWVVCVEEKVLLEYAIPILSRVLKYYPMLCGKDYEWEVLYEISKIDENFWNIHREWKMFFEDIIRDILHSRNERKMDNISEKYICQFETFIFTEN